MIDRAAFPDLVPEAPSPRSVGARVGLAIVGVCLLILGVVGWVLPFVPGVPLLLLGVGLLAALDARVARGLNKLDRRMPARLRSALRPSRWFKRQQPSEQETVSRLFDKD